MNPARVDALGRRRAQRTADPGWLGAAAICGCPAPERASSSPSRPRRAVDRPLIAVPVVILAVWVIAVAARSAGLGLVAALGPPVARAARRAAQAAVDDSTNANTAWWYYVLIPVVAGLVGWGTNWLAIQMTFYPVGEQDDGIGSRGHQSERLHPHRHATHLHSICSYITDSSCPSTTEFTGWRVWVPEGQPVGLFGIQGIIPAKAEAMTRKMSIMFRDKLVDVREVFARIDPAVVAELTREGMALTARKAVAASAEAEAPVAWSYLPQTVRDGVVARAADDAPAFVEIFMAELSERFYDCFDLVALTVRLTAANRGIVVDMFQAVGAKEFRFLIQSGLFFGFALGGLQALVYAFYQANWVLPVFGFLVGYATNWIALTLIFRPVRPVHVSLRHGIWREPSRVPEGGGLATRVPTTQFASLEREGEGLTNQSATPVRSVDPSRSVLAEARTSMAWVAERALEVYRRQSVIAQGRGGSETIHEEGKASASDSDVPFKSTAEDNAALRKASSPVGLDAPDRETALRRTPEAGPTAPAVGAADAGAGRRRWGSALAVARRASNDGVGPAGAETAGPGPITPPGRPERGDVVLQGIFLKRQAEASATLARLASRVFFEPEQVWGEIFGGANRAAFDALVDDCTHKFFTRVIDNTTPGWAARNALGEEAWARIRQRVGAAVLADLPALLPPSYDYMRDKMGVEDVMRTSLSELPPEEFEGVLHPVFEEDEIKLILVGGLLGAGAGALQVLVFYYTG